MSKRSTAAAWLRAHAEQAPLAAVWAAGAALTAVGMYSVAVACGIPGQLAWLYPLIFDGLALVAYRATNRTKDGARRYAAFVVVLCTGLSAVAQAAHLAAGDGLTSGATTHLKAGVGAAPAIAVALAAHLHWLATKPAVSSASSRPGATLQDAAPAGTTTPNGGADAGPGGMVPSSPPGPGPDPGEAGTPAAGLSGQTQTAPAGAPGSAPTTAPAGAPGTALASAPDADPGETSGAPAGLHLVPAASAPETAPAGAPARRRERAASAPGVHRVTARTSAPVRTDEQIASAAASALAADPHLSRRRLARQLGTSQDRLRKVLDSAGGGS